MTIGDVILAAFAFASYCVLLLIWGTLQRINKKLPDRTVGGQKSD